MNVSMYMNKCAYICMHTQTHACGQWSSEVS